jgi:endonuclease/exonuclease/phosphatase family metal-dependent hydrolase
MKRWKRPLGWFSKCVFIINCIVIIALLFSYLAPYINPKSFWPIAFAGIAYPILLLVNIVFIVYWLFRKPTISLLSILSLLIGWTTLNKTVGFTRGNNITLKDTSSLRIMSYNVHLFKGYNGDQEENTKTKILEIFKDVEPDIICIQEFYTRQKGENDVKKSLTKDLGYKHHYFQEAAGNDYDAYGIAIFSKYPIVKSGSLEIHDRKKSVNRIQYADIEKNNVVFRVYNVHLQSIGFQKEDYDFITKRLSNMDEDISSTRRIGSRLKNAFIKRSEQVALLSDHIKECETPYIVTGDFNDTPSSYSVNKISKDMQNAFATKGKGWGITYNGDFPNFQIDYIMASKEFSIHNFQIIPEKLSDHYPLWSDLGL